MKIFESTAIIKIVKIIAVIILISSFTYSFLNMRLWDSDFWWHIATGRYIVATGSLPDKDPFSYTSILEENKNPFPEWENLILKQYWLSQVIFYLIFDYAGAKGIIIMRTALLMATLLLVLRKLQKDSVSFPVSFVFSFILFMALGRLTGERPVLFTIFFTALTFFILDNFKEKKDKKIFFLAPLMLLWANMHGGFIIGIIIIIVFMLGEGIKAILKKGDYTRNEAYMFYAAAILAVGISFVNPAGWDALSVAANISAKYKPIHANIQEYESPLTVYFKSKIYPVQYDYLSMVLLFPVILILRNKKIALSHVLLLSGTLIMSVSAIRFIVYYMIIGAMVIGKESDVLVKDLLKLRVSEKTYNKIMMGLTVVTLFSIVFYVTGIHKFDHLRFDVAKGSHVPEAAVDFVERNKLQGPMLNSYQYGGYMSWRLYPLQKTFIDTRTLNMIPRIEYGWIMYATEYASEVNPSKSNTPLWERLLNHYKVNYILIPMIDGYGQVYPIIFKLVEGDKWITVFCDPISIVFVRNTERNKVLIEKLKLSKEDVYNVMIYRSAAMALNNEVNPRALMSLGDTFYKMERLEDAIKAYKYALDRMPEEPIILERLNRLEEELKSKKQL